MKNITSILQHDKNGFSTAFCGVYLDEVEGTLIAQYHRPTGIFEFIFENEEYNRKTLTEIPDKLFNVARELEINIKDSLNKYYRSFTEENIYSEGGVLRYSVYTIKIGRYNVLTCKCEFDYFSKTFTGITYEFHNNQTNEAISLINIIEQKNGGYCNSEYLKKLGYSEEQITFPEYSVS